MAEEIQQLNEEYFWLTAYKIFHMPGQIALKITLKVEGPEDNL